MAQPAPYFSFPSTPAPAPAPLETTTPVPAPSTQPQVNNTKPEVTTDAYCLYTTQGQIVCSRKADNVAIAPWGSEK